MIIVEFTRSLVACFKYLKVALVAKLIGRSYALTYLAATFLEFEF